jgi:SAM-dependent methyltransferase
MTIKKFSEDEKITADCYAKMIKEHKNGPQIVGWSKKGQLLRFQILSEIGDLNNKTILDVGYGLGDFYDFLTKKKGIKIKKYLGIDINSVMIEKAKKKYPKAEFQVIDLLGSPIEESFDYVFESGTFGVDTPNWKELTSELLVKMFKISKIGIGANFLSDFIPFKKTKGIHYNDPAEILNFANKKLNLRLILRHDYLPHDFTIFIYKKPFNIF